MNRIIEWLKKEDKDGISMWMNIVDISFVINVIVGFIIASIWLINHIRIIP